jgi:hypothetical protein
LGFLGWNSSGFVLRSFVFLEVAKLAEGSMERAVEAHFEVMQAEDGVGVVGEVIGEGFRGAGEMRMGFEPAVGIAGFELVVRFLACKFEAGEEGFFGVVKCVEARREREEALEEEFLKRALRVEVGTEIGFEGVHAREVESGGVEGVGGGVLGGDLLSFIGFGAGGFLGVGAVGGEAAVGDL